MTGFTNFTKSIKNDKFTKFTKNKKQPNFNMLNYALNAQPYPFIIVDNLNKITFINMAGQQFFKGSDISLSGVSLENILPEDSPLLLLINKSRISNITISEDKLHLATAMIGDHIIRVNISPINEYSDDIAIGHIVITLQVKSITAKIDNNLPSRGAAKSVVALSSMLAHEVKNPLSGIRGAAQLLETLIKPDDRQLTKLIIDETDRIVTMINRMEVFYDNPKLQFSFNNIHEILDHVINIAKNGFGKSIDFQKKYDPSLPDIYGNRDQLIQVFLNLVKNSCEAVNQKNGRITIVTSYDYGISMATSGFGYRRHLPFLISIEDNGDGISDDIMQHLFDAFVTTKQNGSGLGLALVAKFINDHGGVIGVKNNKGACQFTISMPIIQDVKSND